MKKRALRLAQNRAFTLIELLVVIAIIAILMALLFPAINGAKYVGQKTQARNDLTRIVGAAKQYQSDYGKYPIAASGASATPLADVTYGTPINATNSTVFQILRNIPSGGTTNPSNPRGVIYIEGKDVKNPASPRGGFDAASAFYDPWGTEYMVFLDGNYDGAVDVAKVYTDIGAGATTTVRTGVAAATLGKDLESGTAGAGGASGNKKLPNSDDIVSWQ